MTDEKQAEHSDDRRAAELEWIAKNRPYQWGNTLGSGLLCKAQSS
jgi:hypothetical protein